MITAKIILDSINEYGNRLTTLQLKYPRFIHSEFMTHRVFSRNASSSRAIPVKKIIETIENEPVYPSYWGKNQSGMQANEELTNDEVIKAKQLWDEIKSFSIKKANELSNLGVHKQITNRILEPYSHINVIVSSTDYNNFFALRRHKDAQPEIKVLADTMYDIISNNSPKLLKYGDWHLPFVNEENDLDILQKMSCARCARVSYYTHDGKTPSLEQDIKLYDRLVGSNPKHCSPLEHQATPDIKINDKWQNPHLHGNLVGYIQYRKTIPYENLI